MIDHIIYILGIILVFIVILWNFIIIASNVLESSKNKKASKKTKAILASSPYRKPPPKKTKEYRAKDKVLENKQKEETKEGLVNKEKKELQKGDDTTIVGLAEPKGFWSKFIMGQKLGFIMARLGAQKKGGGFWTNLIKAQASSQGKDQSRGR